MPGMRRVTRTTRRSVLTAAAVWTLAAAGATPAGSAGGVAAAVDRQSHTFALDEGQTWSLVADVATVRLVGDPARRDVRIDITRHAATAADLPRLPVVAHETPTGSEVILRQSGGRLDPALRAEVTITAPATASRGFITIVEGGLELRGFHGRLEAEVRRGGIDAIDVSGTLRLATTIGAVNVTRARLVAGGLLRLRAFNGDVRLGFAEAPRDARVMALALNGTIRSALPLTMKDGWGPRWGETTVGTGADVVSIDVVTGTIEIDTPAAK